MLTSEHDINCDTRTHSSHEYTHKISTRLRPSTPRHGGSYWAPHPLSINGKLRVSEGAEGEKDI